MYIVDLGIHFCMNRAATLLGAIAALATYNVCSFNATANAQVNVNGYYRSNGTYVQPHQRTAPDGIRSNNYSYPGNYSPNNSGSRGSSYGSGRGTHPSSGFGPNLGY